MEFFVGDMVKVRVEMLSCRSWRNFFAEVDEEGRVDDVLLLLLLMDLEVVFPDVVDDAARFLVVISC